MKKILLIAVLCSAVFTNAQNINDALRFSQSEIQGTARFRAMSGAFGALGGDLSSISLNPASSAVFNSTTIAGTLSSLNTKNQTQYGTGGLMLENNDSDFDLNQGGIVFVFNNANENSHWKKSALSFVYDKTASHDNEWISRGNSNTSIDSYFLNNAQGENTGNLEIQNNESTADAYANIGSQLGYASQQAFLGYQSYILEPGDTNGTYSSNIGAGSFNQQFTHVATGYNGKFAINFATQYKDDLYLGASLNSHFINYERATILDENNTNTNSLINNVIFDNRLRTNGAGFSLQVGGIAKIADGLRLGITYQSPTWYRIEDETTQSIQTFSTNGINLDNGTTISGATVDPQVVNVFPEYKLRTPSKITGSLAYVFGKNGLISFDYATKDYSAIEMKSTGSTSNEYIDINNNISNTLTRANTYRIGGEIKHKQFSFRGGYRFEESPYKNGVTVGDLTGYSAGIGYNFGNTKLDLAVDTFERDYNYQLFETGLTNAASISPKNTNVTLTLGFNL